MAKVSNLYSLKDTSHGDPLPIYIPVSRESRWVFELELSGHKDVRMLKLYSHIHEKAKKEAIVKLGNRLALQNVDTYLDTKSNETLLESNKDMA